MRFVRWAAPGAAMLLGVAPAAAEVLPVLALRPAPAREVSMLASLTVEPFAGRDGRLVSIAAERMLAETRDRGGGLFFDVLAHVDGLPPESEGLVSGIVESDVSTSKFKRTEKRCPKDGPDDCKSAEKIDTVLDCRRRIITLTADVRVIRIDDRAVIFSDTLPQREENSWCPGNSKPSEPDVVIRRLAGNIAATLASAFAPGGGPAETRIREDRKGLAKPLADRFKTAIRLTKTDVEASCREFDLLGEAAPSFPAFIFNRGLCAESAGNYDLAIRYYARLKPAADVREANARIAATQQALVDEEDRAVRLGDE